MKRDLQLIYFNAGGGHRSAAIAIQEVMARSHPEWTVNLINLFDVIDPEHHYQKLTGFAPEDLYNLRLKRGWTRGLSTELKIFQTLIRLSLPKLKNKLQFFWEKTRPDMVVSLVPNFNKVMYQAVTDALPNVPYVTVITDLADYPPNFWIEPGQGQHIICGTEFAASQALASGYEQKWITKTSGMILRPSFYRKQQVNRQLHFNEMGLDTELPTGLVMFGGNGSNDMLKISKELSAHQLIFICGHNTDLAKKIASTTTLAKHVAMGYVQNIDLVMQLSDYFVGKPGPGSLSEAVHMGLPVITFRSAATMPQERYNTVWVEENKLGKVIPSLRELRHAVEELLKDLPVFQSHVQKINNTAVYEVVEALNSIMHSSSQPKMNSTTSPN